MPPAGSSGGFNATKLTKGVNFFMHYALKVQFHAKVFTGGSLPPYYLGKTNPRFVVTSMGETQMDARALYEDFYCARGEGAFAIDELALAADGAVDRIDRTSEGLLLLDYKTAKKYSYKRYEEGQVDNGREFRLQGLLYAAALNQAGLAGVKKTRGTVARSGYLPLRENAKPYLAAWDETAQQQLERHLAAALGLLRHGLVLQSGRCDYCRFGVMCGNGIVQAAQRRLESPQKPKVLEQVRSQYAALCTGGEEA